MATLNRRFTGRKTCLTAVFALATAGGALVAPGVAAADQPAPACMFDAGAGIVTCTYHAIAAEQSLPIPAGVNSVHVVAVGGSGATGAGAEIGSRSAAGGRGAVVTGDVPVPGGHILYVEVGGNGRDGGWPNSGGSGQGGGDGGGSSDVRTAPVSRPTSASTRLLVAAGGGGAGGGFVGATGGVGGDAGQPGEPGISGPGGDVPGQGGGAATVTHGGAAGVVAAPNGNGDAMIGGNGAAALGGGGGGGLFGGGGGGVGQDGATASTSGGGGGGGSSLVPTGGTFGLAAPGQQPEVVVTYRSTTPPCSLTGAAVVLCGMNLPFAH